MGTLKKGTARKCSCSHEAEWIEQSPQAGPRSGIPVYVTCVVQNMSNKFCICWALGVNEKTLLEKINFNQGL